MFLLFTTTLVPIALFARAGNIWWAEGFSVGSLVGGHFGQAIEPSGAANLGGPHSGSSDPKIVFASLRFGVRFLAMLYVSESDLRFLVETVATNRRDYDHIANLVRGKEDLIEPMLEDPKLVERLFRDEEAFVHISPHLLFSVLLRRVRKDLEKETYIFEVESGGKRIPVFEAPAVAELLSDNQICDYLAQMLASFVRTNSGVIYWRDRGAWHKKQFSDIDIDDMIELAQIIGPEMRPALYRRIADLALFLSGIFPDHATQSAPRPATFFSTRRTLKDYEQQGKRFYRVAERETDQEQARPILATLAEQFALARRALNRLSDRYLKTYRGRYFGAPAEG